MDRFDALDIDELPARVTKTLLERLPREKRDVTNALLGYEDGTVGRIMSPMFVDVKRHMTVEEAGCGSAICTTRRGSYRSNLSRVIVAILS